MSNTKITFLDRRLYAWLVESDDKKFERAFNDYFSVAFPAVVRHLMRISRWDLAQLEELAQDALLRFFERVGRGRREASGTVERCMMRVRPMSLGPFHERQVNHWTRDVSSFRDSAMRFQLPPADEPDFGNWRSAIHGLADRIPILGQQGCHILNAVRVELRWECADGPPAAISAIDADVQLAGDLDETVGSDGARRNAAVFVDAITTEVASHSARADSALAKHPRLVEFVDGTFTIICALSRLRVPTNGYLFEIAMSIFLDECKRRGRQKRGGSGVAPPESTVVSENIDTDSQHPIEILRLESENESDSEDACEVAESTSAYQRSVIPAATPAIDPTLQYEHEDLFEKFYEYLRKPLVDATRAYANAANRGRAHAERRRLDALTSKFARTTAVLTLMGEGCTQDRIAEQLAISRNQVKYIIELVQDAYARFAADSRRHAARPPHSREQSNAS